MKDFLSKNKTLVISIVGILIVALLIYLFKDDIKALFSKKDEEPKKDEVVIIAKPPTQTNNSDSNNTYGNSEIGKSVYANSDGVKVLFKADATTYRTKNKGEFIGVITGYTTLAGSAFYSIGKGLVVAKNKVLIK
ncbi:MAG: hypothetical protein A3F72_15290 [Bacteroidetes bacterium RIFCSPLOWO2_12_FULL_35_15]|nr:MAG: hypothetical protein A3F72_15290 [Bacteroidetes bacterium RIFCSPLOWO2_12_FULL_35_15]